jgi:DNA-binding transcriptional LysR family regulator
MPVHAVTRDIAEGRLVVLAVEDVPPGGLAVPMYAIYRDAEPPGPVGRWMIERLKGYPEAIAVVNVLTA